MIDAHPAVAIPPETHFIPNVLRLVESASSDHVAFFRTVTQFQTWPDLHLSRTDFLDNLAKATDFTVADGLRTFYRLYARRFGKDRWGDKTPTYGRHLQSIAQLLPEARFIHLIRDGRDVAVSLRRLWFSPGDSMEALAHYWVDGIRTTRAQAAACPHYIEIRYEDLVKNSPEVLRRITRFLALPYDRRMGNYHRSAIDRLKEFRVRQDADGAVLVTQEQRIAAQRFTLRPPQVSRIGRWRAELSRADQMAFRIDSR